MRRASKGSVRVPKRLSTIDNPVKNVLTSGLPKWNGPLGVTSKIAGMCVGLKPHQEKCGIRAYSTWYQEDPSGRKGYKRTLLVVVYSSLSSPLFSADTR